MKALFLFALHSGDLFAEPFRELTQFRFNPSFPYEKMIEENVWRDEKDKGGGDKEQLKKREGMERVIPPRLPAVWRKDEERRVFLANVASIVNRTDRERSVARQNLQRENIGRSLP